MSVTGPIMAVAGLAGAGISAHGASKAASAQVDAANRAAELQHEDAQAALGFNEQQYSNSLNLMRPYYATGTSSLGTLAQLMGLPVTPGNTSVFDNPLANLPGTVPGPSNPWAKPSAQLTVPSPNFMPQRGTTDVPASGTPGAAGQPFAGTTVPFGVKRNDAGLLEDGSPAIAGNPGDGTSGGLATVRPGTMGFGGGPVPDPTAPGPTTVTASNPNPPAPGGLVPGTSLPPGFLTAPWTEQFVSPDNITEQNDPGFKARLNLATDAMNNSAAAKGNILSGNNLEGLDRFTQDYASNEYGNVYNRALNNFTNRYNIFKQNQQDIFNKYADLAGMGQTSAGQLSSAGLNSANNAGNILLTSGAQIGQDLNNAGAARASGYVGTANALAGGINGLGNLALLYKMLGSGGGNPFAGATATADGITG